MGSIILSILMFLQGEITVQEQLDHEITASYSVLVMATNLPDKQYTSYTVVCMK